MAAAHFLRHYSTRSFAGAVSLSCRKTPPDGRWRHYPRMPADCAGEFQSVLGSGEGYPASARQRKVTLDFFLSRWRNYAGSPMLLALYPSWAAMASDRGLALQLFEEGYAGYDKGRFHQCLEYREDHPESKVPAGPFMADIGGMLMTMLLGLPGLEISDVDPVRRGRRPVVLPAGCKSISVDRLWAGGKPM